jgi:hypothetical protein
VAGLARSCRLPAVLRWATGAVLLHCCVRPGKASRHHFAFVAQPSVRDTRGGRNSYAVSYGRNAEIWPPTNEVAVRLEDSFPGGRTPSVRSPLESERIRKADEEPRFSKRGTVRQILRRAVNAQQELLPASGGYLEQLQQQGRPLPVGLPSQLISLVSKLFDRLPPAAGIILLLRGYVQPLDVLLVTFASGYIIFLTVLASMTRNPAPTASRESNLISSTPILPTLPGQGHIPHLVTNPLGYSLQTSKWYRRYLVAGTLLGAWAPLVLLFVLASDITSPRAAIAGLARPLFVLCAQITTETIVRSRSRITSTPLPIRILIPVLYSVLRLGYVWQWTSSALSAAAAVLPSLAINHVLAWLNVVYSVVHVFGFLIPVAVPRYLRTHYFAVEATSVTVPPGFESDVFGWAV